MSWFVPSIRSAIALGMPILLVAIGVCYTEKGGVWGMNADSSMLGACFFSAVSMVFTGNMFLSLVIGIASGAIMAWLFSIFAVRIGVNQCLVGLGFNFMIMGLTSSLQRLIWGMETPTAFAMIPEVPIPGLSKIPVIGPIFFQQSLLVYFIYFLVPISWWLLFKTTWGMKIRAVGENPDCAGTVGIHVVHTRCLAVTVGGAFSGLGGAFLVLQNVGRFSEMMTGSKAWMGIIAAYFGGWSPLGATWAAFVFGFANALEKRVQLISWINLSSYVVQLFPYIAALIVITLSGGKRRHPAGMAKYYQKQ